MRYLIESVSEMNFSYLHIDEKSLSYNELLKKFVLNNEDSAPAGRDRRDTVTSNSQANTNNTHHHHHSHNSNHNQNSSANIQLDKDHYYNGLAEYVKILINYFFSLMITNLRENIPKTTGYYYIRTLKQDARFFLLNTLTKEFMYENYLEEDPEVAKKRNYFIELMKVLKNSEKTLQYDDE